MQTAWICLRAKICLKVKEVSEVCWDLVTQKTKVASDINPSVMDIKNWCEYNFQD